ncbi:hypothetical protein MPTK2_3g90040P [Marchantia polymorpha subsp. ruderalis]
MARVMVVVQGWKSLYRALKILGWVGKENLMNSKMGFQEEEESQMMDQERLLE